VVDAIIGTGDLRYVWLGTPVIGEQDDDHDDDGDYA